MNCCNSCFNYPISIITKLYNQKFNFLIHQTKPRTIIITRKVLQASNSDSNSNFSNRIETAWLISQQPTPVACISCNSKGIVECKWCGGTGFFILGDNMLCQVPSQNTSCVICAGKGSACCGDCKGTGYRAKWLDKPSISKH